MKRVLPWLTLLILIVLVGCTLPASRQPNLPDSTATLSPDQVQTQINQMLTLMPTSAGQAPAATEPAGALPTVVVPTPGAETGYPAVVTATATTAPPSPTEAAAATATQAPTATPTAAATATAADTGSEAGGGVVPTVAVTPVSPGVPTIAITPVGTSLPTVQITALPTAAAGPTVTPAPGDPRARLGSPSSTDPMDNASTWIWPTGTDKFTTGSFSGGYQLITALTGTDGWRMANPTGAAFTNLYLEATIRTGTCSGSDHYGLIFRVPEVSEPDQGYLFGITCDGRYSLRRWNSEVGQKGEMKWLVNWTNSSAVVSGANQVNRIGVMMVGGRLLLYANGALLTEVQDTQYPSGNFGVFVGSDATENLTIYVDEMSYWLNPQP